MKKRMHTPTGFASGGFTEDTVEVNGISLHYHAGGQGDPVILLHGWPQTLHCWRHVAPELAKRHRVIAVDLRGAGGSSKPEVSEGYDAYSMAEDVRALAARLGLGKVSLVGHDIGMLVAYAYAATHRDEVARLVMLDGLLTGVEPMTTMFKSDPRSWVFGFNQSPFLPEALTAERERLFLSWIFQAVAYNPKAIGKDDLDEYSAAYAQSGAMKAGFEWFRSFSTVAEKNLVQFAKKLSIPVLALGGDHMMGNFMLPMMQIVADDVRGGAIPNCGHWVAEEKPQELLRELTSFLK